MRMWMVDPRILCRKHLLGEHVELHMFVGTLNAGKDLSGYLDGNLLEPAALATRHTALVEEMTRRGYHHKSALPEVEELGKASIGERWRTQIDSGASLVELLRRCPECRERARIFETC